MNKYCIVLKRVVYCLDICNDNCLLLKEEIDLLERLQIGL